MQPVSTSRQQFASLEKILKTSCESDMQYWKPVIQQILMKDIKQNANIVEVFKYFPEATITSIKNN